MGWWGWGVGGWDGGVVLVCGWWGWGWGVFMLFVTEEHFYGSHMGADNVALVMMTTKWEPFSALVAICAGNSLVTDEFPAKRPVTQMFDVFFDLRLNKRWVNNLEAGDLRRYRTHYDVTVMVMQISGIQSHCMRIPGRWWLWSWYSANDLSDSKFLEYCFMKLSERACFNVILHSWYWSFPTDGARGWTSASGSYGVVCKAAWWSESGRWGQIWYYCDLECAWQSNGC